MRYVLVASIVVVLHINEFSTLFLLSLLIFFFVVFLCIMSVFEEPNHKQNTQLNKQKVIIIYTQLGNINTQIIEYII